MRSWMMGLALATLQLSLVAIGQSADPNLSQIASAPVDWRTSGEPVLMSGAAYYPSGPTVFFDGNVMVRSGSFKGLSIYVDSTRDPYNVVYVPLGGKLMRPYERRRADQVADIRVPPPPALPADIVPIEESSLAAGVAAPPEAVEPETAEPGGTELRRHGKHPAAAVPLSPGANRGIWIAFNDKVWLLSDRQPYLTRDLMPIGTYHGFPVYRDPGRLSEIFVSSGTDGFLARYTLEGRK